MVPEGEDREECAITQNSEGGFSYLPCMAPRQLDFAGKYMIRSCVCFGGSICCSV